MLWDRFIRIFHWSVALLFFLNYFFLEEGEDLHEWAGYAILALVCARVIWGFVGPELARFRHFYPSPARVVATWRNFSEACREHRGHNPIAGLMVFFLLFMLVLTGVSGWMQELDYFWGETWVETLHEIAAHLVLAAVVIHVASVLIIQFRYKVRLVQSMLLDKNNK